MKTKKIIIKIICVILFTALHINAQPVDKDDAFIITQSYPTQMFTGNEYTVTIRVKNAGTTIWTPEYYSLKQLSSANSYDNIWNVTETRVESNIYPGAIETFGFIVKAPGTPGKYEFKWSMYANGSYFGAATDSDFVNVIGPYPSNELSGDKPSSNADNSAFLQQVLTDTMTTGMTYEVTVTMQNNGSTAWTKEDGYHLSFLSSLMNTDKNNLIYESVPLPRAVMPGEQATFVFNINAPNVPGSYNFAWIMEHGNQPFGVPSALTIVTVRKGNQQAIDEGLQK